MEEAEQGDQACPYGDSSCDEEREEHESSAAAVSPKGSSFRIALKWYFIGKDTSTGPEQSASAEVDCMIRMKDLLHVNSYTKEKLRLRYPSDRLLIVKTPEILQFPAEYAVWSNEELVELPPLDKEKWNEPICTEEKDCVFLYGLAACREEVVVEEGA